VSTETTNPWPFFVACILIGGVLIWAINSWGPASTPSGSADGYAESYESVDDVRPQPTVQTWTDVLAGYADDDDCTVNPAQLPDALGGPTWHCPVWAQK
jgi:hypothetical protein